MKKIYYVIIGAAVVLYEALKTMLKDLFRILIYEPLRYLYHIGKETITTQNEEKE